VLGPNLFVLYAAEVLTIARSHGFTAHAYADDLQQCMTTLTRITIITITITTVDLVRRLHIERRRITMSIANSSSSKTLKSGRNQSEKLATVCSTEKEGF
jgi:hypothetical protein